ncbi:MAG TPA: ribosome-associated translation inhibitor RaiA [Cytophagales bacterium]|nr:ribosome-associated translation inhibitor RaiA [Cytophagales bacterium]
MKVQVQAIHFDADVKLIEFIEKKANKLSTFFDRIIDIEVFLKVAKKETRNNKIVEFRINVPGNTLFATESGDTFEAATDEVLEAMKSQLKKHKEKLTTSHTL